jgi:hypothetical protein
VTVKITAQNQGGLGAFALRPFTKSLDVDALPDDEQAQARALIDSARQGGGPSIGEPAADGMVRRLIIEDGEVSHTLIAPDRDADPAFVTLWNWVQRQAR